MQNSSKKHMRLSSFIRYILLTISTFSVIYILVSATIGVKMSYSYWFDELCTVTAVSLPFKQMLSMLTVDFNPPLYNFLMWIWVHIFNSSEIVCRLPSLIAISAGLYMFIITARLLTAPARYYVLILVGCTWILPFYAQETRSYALLFCMSSCTLYFFLKNNTKVTIMFATVLGLTHFFGTIMSALILVWILFANLRNRRIAIASIIAGIVIVIWPVTLLLFFSLGNKLGGNFWIVSAGPLDTLAMVLRAVLPIINMRFSFMLAPVSVMLLLTALFTFGIITVKMNCLKKVKKIFQEELLLTQKVAYLVSGCIIIPLLIDLHTPISQPRNFMVLIPCAIIFIAILMGIIAKSRVIFYVLVSFFLVMVYFYSLKITHAELHVKQSPLQNWRTATQYIVELRANYEEKLQVYYLIPDKTKWNNLINNYYLGIIGNEEVYASPLYYYEIEQLPEHWIMLYGQMSPHKFCKRLNTADIKYQIYYPPQALTNHVGVIYSDSIHK